MLNINLNALFLSVALTVLLASCGGDSSSDVESTSAVDVDDTMSYDISSSAEELEEVDMVESLESDTVPNSDWQINNYANFLIGENIAADQESYDPNEGGAQWYYQTLDVKGGFAYVTGAVEGWKEFVVWRMADGDDLVGEMTVECGPACGYTFNFYKGRGAEIAELAQDKLFPLDEMIAHQEEMTAKIIEKHPVDYPEDSQLIFNFPQKGTGMTVDVNIGADEIQVPIIKLAWDKTKFYIDELLTDPNPVNG
jgi:hypothetical protein